MTIEDLKDLSLIAYQQEDWDWLHDICKQMEQVQLKMENSILP